MIKVIGGRGIYRAGEEVLLYITNQTLLLYQLGIRGHIRAAEVKNVFESKDGKSHHFMFKIGSLYVS